MEKMRAAKLEVQEFAEEKEDGDYWIPFKFPERSIAVRSAEAAQRLSVGVKSYCAEVKSWRNRDRPFARTGGIGSGAVGVMLIEELGIGVSRVPCSITTKTLKSRYAISRFDLSR
jgi:hypothetical protein